MEIGRYSWKAGHCCFDGKSGPPRDTAWAMSEENVELVRRLLDMFAKREHEGVFELYDPDIEWDASPNLSPGGVDDLAGVYHGHEGVRNYWRRWLSAWKDIQFEVQDVLDADGEVVALIHNQRMWGRRTAASRSTSPRWAGFHDSRRQVVRWRSFRDQKSALEAAGLSE